MHWRDKTRTKIADVIHRNQLKNSKMANKNEPTYFISVNKSSRCCP